MSDAPENPAICHMTHVHNLPTILREGGLWCDTESQKRGLCEQPIGLSHIKERRAKRKVTKSERGFVSDYVPFYFWHHSPMLYLINQGRVPAYKEGRQEEIIYLVSSVSKMIEYPFCFTDGHAEMAITLYFDDTKDFDKLDWLTIKAKQWSDTPENNDRKRRKQAEFLVHGFVPWDSIQQIGVMTEAMGEQVRDILGNPFPLVQVRRQWYY